jgi:hypothetical protein
MGVSNMTSLTAVGATARRLTLAALLALCSVAPAAAQVTLTREPDRIVVDVDGAPFTVVHVGGAGLNRVSLHPLRTASGKVVTRSVPAGQLPGETTDHPHHVGLFYGHGDVSGVNFWAIRDGVVAPGARAAAMGRIVVKEVSSVRSGDRTGVVDLVLSWLRPDGTPLLTETRSMTFHAQPDLRMVDVDVELLAIERAVFRDTKEGTFAMRMATVLEEPPAAPKPGAAPRTGRLLNAQGATGEANVWGRRSEWVDYSGRIDGEPVGVVMMDHPGNPRHPTYWHSRGYGLHSINPFGVSDFLGDKTQDGSLTLEPGQRVRFRYRVIVHQGASPAKLAELFKTYAATGTPPAR